MPGFRKDPRDQRPETIPFSTFAGLKNTVSSERLEPADLEAAVNVDIDDAGQLRRRRGQTEVAAGNFHSLSSSTVRTYVVKDGAICLVNPNYTFTQLLAGAGPDPVCYQQPGDDVYFSSASVSGIIRSDLSVDEWGAEVSPGVWWSPVVNPTATLSPIKGKLLGKPPMATAIVVYHGRMYLASENVLWVTELYAYSKVDKTRNYVMFEANITMLGAVEDGIYVGTEAGVWFLSGAAWPMRRVSVTDDAVVAGSMIPVPGDLVNPGGQSGTSPTKGAVMFMTTGGLCVGMDGGACYNLTQTRHLFPAAQSGAAMFRKQDGLNQYVGVLNSGGTPVSDARIGDYLDGEIVRFRGA